MFDQTPEEGGFAPSVPDAVVRIDIVVSLLERGWLQKGWHHRKEHTLCFGQALLDAYRLSSVQTDQEKKHVLGAMPLTHVIMAAVRMYREGAYKYNTIVDFNDDPETKLSMLLDILCTVRRWLVDGTSGLDITGKKARKRLEGRLRQLHDQLHLQTVMA